jgi:nitric oxide reductase NorD protein
LPRAEQEVDDLVLALLGADASPQGWLWPVVIGAGNLPAKAPRGYRPMLPCPLWGDCWTRAAVPGEADDDAAPVPGNDADPPDTRKRRAVRQSDDGSKRDPFILNRLEKILAMAEMVNVNRPSNDGRMRMRGRPPTTSMKSRSAVAAASPQRGEIRPRSADAGH